MRRKLLPLLLALLVLAGALCGCSGLLETAERFAPPEGSVSDGSASGAPDASAAAVSVREDGQYSTPEEVAAYLHQFGKLPGNFISKTKARKLGWDSGRDLWDYAPGMSIGGGAYGNYEGTLPSGTSYKECDVNYYGGHRGAERIVFGEDGSVWYTKDHYETFTRLY